MATTASLITRRRLTVAVESVTRFAGWTIVTLAAAQAVWVLLPTLLLGWEPMVVTSGSMEPSISIGDVVLIDPGFGAPGQGTVVAFDTEEGATIHRVVSVSPDGTLVTQGDANANPDPTRIRADEVVGAGRLLVPYIGLIRIAHWPWLAVVVLVAATLALTRLRGASSSAALLAITVAIATSTAAAAFATTESNVGSSAAALDLSPPTTVTASCGLIGSGAVNVDLTWTASPTVGITGYRIYRDGPMPGSDFVAVGTATSGATSFTDSIPTPIDLLGTHTYLVRSYSGSWESESSNNDAVSITRPLIVYVCTNL